MSVSSRHGVSGGSEGATRFVIIPAYKPSEQLVDLVAALDASDVDGVIVVDDGSGVGYAPIFDRIRRFGKSRVLRHAVNLGKGAALKTGLNHALCEDADCIAVTADADGQHRPEDILEVLQQATSKRDALVLGVRNFDRAVPFRSRLGNEITRIVLRVVLGYALKDTQTGLRGVPARIAPHLLGLSSRRYEFELDMLVLSHQLGVPIIQTAIQTVYLKGNASSHFNPLLDSMRIYFALLRFILAALSTSLLDNVTFILLHTILGAHTPLRLAVLVSQIGARLVAMVFNYAAVKRLVFSSRQSHARALPKYLALVTGSAAVSYMMITFFVESAGVNVLLAKVLAEALLFIPNFVIQRDLVFRRPFGDDVSDTDV
jgi:putative flippase GtrA